jgi:hypothetical protein
MGFAVVPAAEAGGKAATRVTIDSAFSTPGGSSFSGDIFSSRKACKNNRQVLVYRQKAGTDQKIGQTRSFQGLVDPGYFWVLFKKGEFYPSGQYYAKVNPTSKCKGDKSGLLASDF